MQLQLQAVLGQWPGSPLNRPPPTTPGRSGGGNPYWVPGRVFQNLPKFNSQYRVVQKILACLNFPPSFYPLT